MSLNENKIQILYIKESKGKNSHHKDDSEIEIKKNAKKLNIDYIDCSENIEGNYSHYVAESLLEIKKLKELNFERVINYKKLNFNQIDKNKKVLLLDLDEVLVHTDFTSEYKSTKSYDLKLIFETKEYQTFTVGSFIRIGAKEFIEELSKNFEIGVFTASTSEYANKIIDFLDPENKFIKHRFFKEHCIKISSSLYIKDLTIFQDLDLKNVVILENNIFSFANQLSNGILINSFYGEDDTHLKYIYDYLIEFIYPALDVRVVNDNTFHYKEIASYL